MDVSYLLFLRKKEWSPDATILQQGWTLKVNFEWWASHRGSRVIAFLWNRVGKWSRKSTSGCLILGGWRVGRWWRALSFFLGEFKMFQNWLWWWLPKSEYIKAMRYHYTSTVMAQIRNTGPSPNGADEVQRLQLSFIAGGGTKWDSQFGR